MCVPTGRTDRDRTEAAAELERFISGEALNTGEQRTIFGPPNDSLHPLVNMTLDSDRACVLHSRIPPTRLGMQS